MEAANDNRPAEFDARVMQYKQGLEALASKLTNTKEEREDLVTDTIIYCLGHWRSFRPEGGFYNWLYWSMRGVLSLRRDAARRQLKIVADEDGRLLAGRAVDPSQIHHVELVETLETMDTREGQILLRRVMTDDKLHEIGADLGISKERVRQLEEQERDRLRARAA
ncbi:sigma-70 family RNA polymerase sigma factor [Rhizobium lentis]|uniref:sigma-70 family RNA polymerase sigma factor n=1 Tax=Rhizobium lentis TaxID=1138194 RepID=UPI001C829ACC|nr:sigma-70 family RNA polymerase sigma factor [Rhizobium lentis]MBX5010866.1 sigma-70 family RNA polymerase sigma factor [Rhizobium lentis]